ncbi:hypothetical protein MKL09_06695 [Methylobacterium sp. J-048]|uniref:hypothetical protein n=1 Tax=Methylobacterium sp. J-048 TaxID=2836635 RepID=UPI001FBBC725|nr:hypothetical protein [Methylobacterium sp. J-048]MCJ2056235.1 hypothetical protein [Methylobacterium sp. J-048]
MTRLLARFARLFPGTGAPAGEQPAADKPQLSFPMLDGGILVYADLAAHLVDLPCHLRERTPHA